MLFAHNIVLADETKEGIISKIEGRKETLESKG